MKLQNQTINNSIEIEKDYIQEALFSSGILSADGKPELLRDDGSQSQGRNSIKSRKSRKKKDAKVVKVNEFTRQSRSRSTKSVNKPKLN